MSPRLLIVAATLLVAGAPLTRAQTSVIPNAEASLNALVGEVRQLRVAVEESARNQTQVQATSVFLSAIQARIMQMDTALNTVRADLRSAVSDHEDLVGSLAEAQTSLAGATDAKDRAQYIDMVKMFTSEVDKSSAQEQQLRSRESQLMQQLQVEEQRWADLVAKLDQIMKK